MKTDVFEGASLIGASSVSAPVIFKRFKADKSFNATIYFLCLGFGEVYLNGEKISDGFYSPNSDYHKRENMKLLYPLSDEFSYSQYYRTINVEVPAGDNIISVFMGNGWYNQTHRVAEGRMDYGEPCFKLSMDGDVKLLSRGDWQAVESPIIYNQLFAGEVYDGNVDLKKCLIGDGEECEVYIYPEKDAVVRPALFPPDRVIKSIKPKRVGAQNGGTIYDMGINQSGRAQITTDTAGQVKLTFAEKLKDGKMDYGSADSSQIQTDLYVGNGSKGQTYAPRFCWHGFRYVLVEGDITDITCDIIHTDIKPVGEFVTKNSVINGYIDMFLNSLWSNMHCGVPSDCPHRERLGYTGDGQLTAGAAMRFADLRSFYRKWMRDIADGQCQKTGHVQHTAPFGGGGGGPAGWGGAVITVPYNFYRIYKERDILEEYFPNMQRYVAYMEAKCEDDLVVKEEEGGWCLGEWCAPGGVTIDPCFVNTCMYIEQLSMLLDICGVIGDDSAENIKTLIDRKRDAVRRKFIKADDIAGNKQGAAAFAYMAGVIDAKTVEKAIKEQDLAHLDTGIFGTPRLIETLLRLDMDEKAVELLSDTGFPSFGYMLENGATTLWEYFEGGSNNHPMFGAAVGVLIDVLLERPIRGLEVEKLKLFEV